MFAYIWHFVILVTYAIQIRAIVFSIYFFLYVD